MSDPYRADPDLTDAARGTAGARTAPPPAVIPPRRTGWVGWVWFGGAILVLVGIFNVIHGLVAIVRDQVFVVAPQSVLLFDVTGWGWVHLILGVIQIAIGAGIFAGARWALALGFLAAMVNAAFQLVSLPIYPIWSIIIIALDVVVVYALIVHGDEARA